MSCQTFKNQIDEAVLTKELHRHLEFCSDCKTFKQERECLNQLLTKLETINAPANFEFGVRAKLNSLPTANNSRVWKRRLIFASPAVAAVAVSAFAFSNYNFYSLRNSETPIVVQQSNVASIEALLPAVSPTAQIVAATNFNSPVISPVTPKQSLNIAVSNAQIALQTNQNKQKKQTARQSDETVVSGRDVFEPKRSNDEAVRSAPRIVQPEFAGKIDASNFLQFFGIEKISDDGTVESIAANSEAAKKGIVVGDRIETVNGQKLDSNNLNNSFRQIILGISRKDGNKRIVAIDVKTETPK